MTYAMLYEKSLKPWLDTNDIMLVANCGRNSAIKIRRKIEDNIVKEGKVIPPSYEKVIPTNRLMDYLGLDIDYIYKMALKEKGYNLQGVDK